MRLRSPAENFLLVELTAQSQYGELAAVSRLTTITVSGDATVWRPPRLMRCSRP